MRRAIDSFVLLFLLASCGTSQSTPKASTGPSVGLGPVSVGLRINSDGEVDLDKSLSIPILGDKDLGAGLNWEVTFSTVLREASNKNNYLIVLWQDENGSTKEEDFPIGRPFEINFEHDQWVRKIQRLDNGSIVVFVEKQKLAQEVSSNNSQPGNLEPTEPPLQTHGYWCDDLDNVKLKIGDEAKVVWMKVNLRSEPRVSDVWDANVVAQLDKGASLTVIDGPACAHEGTWWEVSVNNGQTGWIREYEPSKGYLLKRK